MAERDGAVLQVSPGDGSDTNKPCVPQSGYSGPPTDRVGKPAADGALRDSAYAAGHFLAEKAGMQGVDKAYVAKVVKDASEGSKYYINAQAREAALTTKIEKLKESIAKVSPSQMAAYEAAMNAFAAKAEAERDLTCISVCCDMDQFFAAVEMRSDPKLTHLPFAVGGMGMISTASYEARKYGVRSAMPGFIGIKLCPQLVFVKPNFATYEVAAKETREVFKLYDPDFLAGSLDEAFLDLTHHCRQAGILPHTSGHVPTPEEQERVADVVKTMRQQIKEATRGLTCSAGIAANGMLAKMASNEEKPDGQFMIPFDREAILKYVLAQPVRKIPGVGKVTEKTLVELGIHSCEDILKNKGLLRAAFTERMACWLIRCALGISAQQSHGWAAAAEDEDTGVGRKSLSQERTFHDCGDLATLLTKCQELLAEVSKQLKEEKITGKTITVKMKLHTFEVRQRAITLSRSTNDEKVIAATATQILKGEMPIKLRLLGVRVSALECEETTPTVLDRFIKASHTKLDSDEVQVVVESDTDSEVELVGHQWVPRKRARPRIEDFFYPRVQGPFAQPTAAMDEHVPAADALEDSVIVVEDSSQTANSDGTVAETI